MGAPASFNPHSKNKDHIGWFEIPVYDLGRAVQFYGTIRNMRMEIVETATSPWRISPPEEVSAGHWSKVPAAIRVPQACSST